MVRAVFLILALAAAPALAATPTMKPLPSFEFRGHKVGEDMFTAFDTNKPEQRCWRADDGLGFQCVNTAETDVGGIPIKGIGYRYLNNKLFGVQMQFAMIAYPTIREMLIGKYGEPASETTSMMRNGFGNTFERRTSVWRFAEGNMTVISRNTTISDAILDFSAPEAVAAINGAKTTEAREAGKNAF